MFFCRTVYPGFTTTCWATFRSARTPCAGCPWTWWPGSFRPLASSWCRQSSRCTSSSGCGCSSGSTGTSRGTRRWGGQRQRSYRQQTLRSYRVGLVWFSGEPCFQERPIRYFTNPYAFTLIPLQGYVPRPFISISLSPLPEGDSIQVLPVVSFLEAQTLPTELPGLGIPIGYDMAKSRRAEVDLFLQNDTGSKIVRGSLPPQTQCITVCWTQWFGYCSQFWGQGRLLLPKIRVRNSTEIRPFG